MADKPQSTRLRITACTATYTGYNARGDEYTIYEVQAVKSGGEIVAEKLTSFENLPLEVLDLTVSKYVSEKHGVSYTLARKSRPSSAQKYAEVVKEIEDLRGRVVVLEEGAKPSTSAPAETTQVQQPAEAPPSADLDARFGVDAPF